MHEETLKAKLKTMYVDLTFTSKEANMLVGLLTDSVDDREQILKHLYFGENAPVKVLSFENEPRGKGDITEEVIDLCMGYDRYSRNISREVYNLLDRHNRALKLFINMMSLPYPFAQILYLRYFKDMTVDEIRSETYLSKSGFYRKYEKAMSLLLDKMKS